MSYKINRRDFLRATTTASALAASSAVVLRVPSALNSTTEDSSVLTVESQEPDTDFSKEFTGEGLDYRPLSYWPHINFFYQDENFYKVKGEEVVIAEFILGLDWYVWITARKNDDRRIFYQILSNSELGCFTGPNYDSWDPLSLRDLISFIDNAEGFYLPGGVVKGVWESNYETDYPNPSRAVSRITVNSSFYADLAPHYDNVANSWIAEKLEELFEFDDEYEV